MTDSFLDPHPATETEAAEATAPTPQQPEPLHSIHSNPAIVSRLKTLTTYLKAPLDHQDAIFDQFQALSDLQQAHGFSLNDLRLWDADIDSEDFDNHTLPNLPLITAVVGRYNLKPSSFHTEARVDRTPFKIELLGFLLGLGVSPLVRDNNGYLSIDWCIGSTQYALIGPLLEAADHRAFLSTYNPIVPSFLSLNYAFERNDPPLDVIDLFLQHGSPINGFKHHAHSPLMTAIYWQNLEATTYLLSKGADLHAVHDHSSAIHMAAAIEDPAILTQLIEKGADVNPKTHSRKLIPTPLHSAALYGYLPNIRLLVEHGAALSVLDFDGKTPEQVAQISGENEAYELLKSFRIALEEQALLLSATEPRLEPFSSQPPKTQIKQRL